jgi:biopolymer transport protein ExbD
MRKRNKGELAKLEMTPMIDVIFQLLIFFVVTLKTPEMLSHLDVSRPRVPDVQTPIDIEFLTIQISPTGWVMNGKPYAGTTGFASMERDLARIASFSRNASVMIKCTADAPHGALIRTLNACARENMQNIALFSL